MQPSRRQVPPSSGSFSMQTVLAPSWAARIAAVYPPGPPPRTATSHSIVSLLRLGSPDPSDGGPSGAFAFGADATVLARPRYTRVTVCSLRSLRVVVRGGPRASR